MALGVVRGSQCAQAARSIAVRLDVVFPSDWNDERGPTDPALLFLRLIRTNARESALATQCAAGDVPALGAPAGGGIFIAPGFIIICPGPGNSRLVKPEGTAKSDSASLFVSIFSTVVLVVTGGRFAIISLILAA